MAERVALTGVDAPPARRQLLVGVLTLVGLYAVVFGPAVITSVRMVVTGGSPAPLPADWQARAAQFEGDVFAVMVVLGIVLRWLPRHAPGVVSRLGLRRAPGGLGGLLGGAAAYVAIALSSGWLGDRAVAVLSLPRTSYPDIGHGAGALIMGTAASVAAAITEEITLLVLVVALVEYGTRKPSPRWWWVVPATLGLAIGLRWTLHVYYGWGSLFVLAWVPGVYLLYRSIGSVWPLVLGHATYDVLLTAEHAYPGPAPLIEHALVGIAAFGIVGAVARYGLRNAGPRRVGSGTSRSWRPRRCDLR